MVDRLLSPSKTECCNSRKQAFDMMMHHWKLGVTTPESKAGGEQALSGPVSDAWRWCI